MVRTNSHYKSMGIFLDAKRQLTPQSKNSEYDQEIPQSQTADNPVVPRSSGGFGSGKLNNFENAKK